MTDIFIERDCVIEHEGRKFESGGSYYDGQWFVVYLSGDMKRVRTWHGDDLGSARVVSSWPMPRSWISQRQYQIEATIEGVVYTGRTMGGGFVARLRRKAALGRKP